jgi:hypothetical protein
VDLTVVLNNPENMKYNEIITEGNHGPMIRVHLEAFDVNVDVNWLSASELRAHVAEHGAADWYMFLNGKAIHDPRDIAKDCRNEIRGWFEAHPQIFEAWERQQAEVEKRKRNPEYPLEFPTQPGFLKHLRGMTEGDRL